ncbi:MAG TPA: DsbA family protein [Thermoleophilaceae bacterium]|jgi:predicted DsbA family dithiol-disulfide isomerase|nr:DsbA family protein [Thermoleophilaceae bacterium]
MAVLVRYHTDPACSASWAAEPRLRRLVVEFGESVDITYVMGGLAREFEDLAGLVMNWLDHAAEADMPVDPRIWSGDSPRSSYPACIAFKAAAEQGRDAAERYLRALREGFMCFRRKLDAPEALVEEARRAGLDAQRFRIDLESHGSLEAFGSDLERARTISDAARDAGLATEGSHGSALERLQFPALSFAAPGGDEIWVGGDHSYDDWSAAAIQAGATLSSEPRPDVPGALARFGHMATAELAAVCDLPGPRAGAEAWRLASDWRAKRLPVLFGELWEPV